MYHLFCSEAGSINPQVAPLCEGPDIEQFDIDVDSGEPDQSPAKEVAPT